jgi:hypothetical protein
MSEHIFCKYNWDGSAVADTNYAQDRFPYTILTGMGGQISTLAEAAALASSVSPQVDRQVQIVLTPNTNFYLSEPVELPEYCEIVGMSRTSSKIIASNNNNIRYSKNNSFRNFTLEYSGSGATSGGFRPSTNIGAGAQDESTLIFDSLNLDVVSGQRSAIWLQAAHFVEILRCRIRTSGMGIEIVSGFHTHIRDTDIFLTNVDTNKPHYGIRHVSTRTTLWNCKITTGYGPLDSGALGIENEPDQDMVGIYCASTSGANRVDIYNLWSIIRNEDGANAGIKCVGIWNSSNFTTVRVHSGYLQVENSTDSAVGDNYEILNTATPSGSEGLIQVSPSVRARRVGGPIYQVGPVIGYPEIVTANITLGIGRGGLYRINATSGNITVTLPTPGTSYTPNITHTERYLFKRIVTASNTITITAAGSGVTIQGSASVNLGSTLYDQLELVWSSEDNMWLII